MWLVVLPLVLAVGLVCGDAPTSFDGTHLSPSDAPVLPGQDLACPTAKDIAPCVCTFDLLATTMDLDCSNVTSEDQLAQIFTGHFPFKNFTKLDIYNNQNLKVLRAGVFDDVSFENIRIMDGQLVEIQEGALSGSFTTAIEIDFFRNKISSFPFIEIERFSKLEWFLIHYNNIQSFPSIKSSTLLVLVLSSNPLTNLPATALRDLPNIDFCALWSTNISQIEPGTFSGLPRLRYLNLSYNNIQHIPAGAIQFNDTITALYLFIADSGISSIEVGAVIGIKQGTIYFDDNLLEELDEAVFRPILDNRNNLRIFGNPLKCGCDIAWLITNQTYMDRLILGDHVACPDGAKLTELDPQFYMQSC